MRRRFNCNQCVREGWIDDEQNAKTKQTGRTCFLYNCGLPIKGRREEGGGEYMDWPDIEDADRLFEVVAELLEEYPDGAPVYEVLTRMFPNVCPQGLVESEVVRWIQLEGLTQAYHQLPFPGGLLDQPQRVLDVFEVIRGQKNDYDIRTMKTQTGGGKSGG